MLLMKLVLEIGPSNPTVTTVSKTEVLVSWEPPHQPALSRLKCYEVYINNSSKPAYCGTQNFCLIRGIKQGFQYHFKVGFVCLTNNLITNRQYLISIPL